MKLVLTISVLLLQADMRRQDLAVCIADRKTCRRNAKKLACKRTDCWHRKKTPEKPYNSDFLNTGKSTTEIEIYLGIEMHSKYTTGEG